LHGTEETKHNTAKKRTRANKPKDTITQNRCKQVAQLSQSDRATP